MWPFKSKTKIAEQITPSDLVTGEAPVPVTLTVGGTRLTPYAPNAGRVMITDGGPHPASAWAMVTAQHITPISANMAGDRYNSALKLQLSIAEALQAHHEIVQNDQRHFLGTKGDAHLDGCMNGHDPRPYLHNAMQAIVGAAKGTPWENHFLDPARQESIKTELAVHFNSSQHIEHSWYADRAVKNAEENNTKVSKEVANWLSRHSPNHPHATKVE